MNSGMETVSISTKSALPNSRLSCSAMAPAHGLRWARTGSGGRARAAGAGPGARGELGRGRGGAAARGAGRRGRGRRSAGLGRTEAAQLLHGALSAGAALPAVSASPAAAARRCGGRDTETETAAAGPASGLGLARAPRPPAPPRPGRASPAPPRRSRSPPPPRLRPPPPHLGGAHARAGRRGRAPGQAGLRRRGGSAPWGWVLGSPGAGGPKESRRRRVGGLRLPGLPASARAW